jgi:cell division protein FtsB
VARLIHWKFVLFLLVLTFLFFAFGRGDEGLYQLWQEWQALEVAQQQVARLQAENDSLRQVLWRLENDLEYVEKVAREEYGMSKQGERIYRLRHSTTKKSKKD